MTFVFFFDCFFYVDGETGGDVVALLYEQVRLLFRFAVSPVIVSCVLFIRSSWSRLCAF